MDRLLSFRFIFVFWCCLVVTTYLARADDMATGGNADKQSSSPVYHTYIILFKDADNPRNDVNCSIPTSTSNDTSVIFDRDDLTQKWSSPPGVTLIGSSGGGLGDNNQKGAWVELTPQNTLVFHSPDKSVSGRYTCSSSAGSDVGEAGADKKVVYRTSVFVHVLQKSVFDVGKSMAVGVVSTIVFLACIAALYGVSFLYQKRTRYTVARQDEDNLNLQVVDPLREEDKIHVATS